MEAPPLFQELFSKFEIPPRRIEQPRNSIVLSADVDDAVLAFENHEMLPGLCRDGRDLNGFTPVLFPHSIISYLMTTRPGDCWSVEEDVLNGLLIPVQNAGSHVYEKMSQEPCLGSREGALRTLFYRSLLQELAMVLTEARHSVGDNWIEDLVMNLADGGGVLIGYFVDSYLHANWTSKPIPDLKNGRAVIYYLPGSPNASKV